MYLNKKDLQNQCTRDTYARLVHGNPEPDVFLRKVQQLIKSRYTFLTYESLVSYIEQHPKVTDKVIIVDEAHNLRQQETEKKAAEALETLLKNGERNRLVLLSATPMYNEPDEILWLLHIMLMNDKRKNDVKLPNTLFEKDKALNKTSEKLLSQLASEYISYIRGKNPFTFAVRLSPKASGYTLITEDWAASIKDGIVPSIVGKSQKIEDVGKKTIVSSPKSSQWMNITYPGNSHGESGFWKVFSRTSSEDQAFPVNYRSTYKNTLMPNAGLQDIASKMNTICNIIQKTEGIVIIYSQYVWSGVVPLAIALEHMGFRRAVGPDDVQNIVSNIELVQKPVTYPGISFPKYCILSGDSKVMGSSKIESLRKVINQHENRHGEKIKVVLITPIAGEGLSFQNVREVHILDPWYHMNRTEQVIGRAIRTCSHNQLPLEERNVSVFLHACVMDGKDTADIHAYKIAAHKLYQTSIVEKLIRDHAFDCSLQYHLNYHPQSLFAFHVAMRTSQQTIIQHAFGDTEENKPSCSNNVVPDQHSAKLMRREVYSNVVPTVLHRIRRYVQKKAAQKEFYITMDELMKVSGTRKEIAYDAINQMLLDDHFLDGMRIYAHRNEFVIIPTQEVKPQYELVVSTQKTETQTETGGNCDANMLLSAIPKTDLNVATTLLYTLLDSVCWDTIARTMIQDQIKYKHILDILASHGSLVLKKELPRFVSSAKGDFIGYVNIFPSNIDADPQIYLMNQQGSFVAANEADVKLIMQRRNKWEPPSQENVYGIWQPKISTKDANAPLRNTLKLMLPGPSVGKRRGVVCTSNTKGDILQWIRQFGNDNQTEEKTKDQLCFTLSLELLKKGALYIYPGMKPT
jgi:hypothetical protein